MYTTIKVQCVDQNLTVIEEPVVASGGKNEDVIRFTFCNLWAGMAKTAVFWHDKKPKEVYHALIGIEGECIVPHEVLSVAGRFFVGVMGVKDETRRTTTTLAFTVKPGVEKKGIASAPTQTIYEQLLADYATSTAMMESIVADARTAATVAGNASSDAKAAAAKAESAAEDAAQEAMAASEEVVRSAVAAAQAAQKAAEDAAAAAKEDVLEMGAVLYASGTYTGTGGANTITLPVAPKLVHIWGEPKFSDILTGKPATTVTLMSGSSDSVSLAQDQVHAEEIAAYNSDGEELSYGVSYKPMGESGSNVFQFIKLSGNQITMEWHAITNTAATEAVSADVDFLNENGKTYNWIAFY